MPHGRQNCPESLGAALVKLGTYQRDAAKRVAFSAASVIDGGGYGRLPAGFERRTCGASLSQAGGLTCAPHRQ